MYAIPFIGDKIMSRLNLHNNKPNVSVFKQNTYWFRSYEASEQNPNSSPPPPPHKSQHLPPPPPIKINLLKVAELLPRDLFSTALPAPPKEKSLNTFP